ncbi:MAG: hypothetical protein R2698_15085 [Microthrixaceae bacterium]
MTKQRHIREGDRLDDEATIVIRGGALNSGVELLVTCEYVSWINPCHED